MTTDPTADALAAAAQTVDDYAALDRAIGSVLFNVSNFPAPAQARLLGQNMRPLTEKLVDAVLAAGFHRQGFTEAQVDAAAKAMYHLSNSLSVSGSRDLARAAFNAAKETHQ